MFSILFATLLNTALAAQPSACPVQKSATLPPACLLEVTRAIGTDSLSVELRKTLERTRRLTTCRRVSSDKLEWKFAQDEATGSYLEASLLYTCESAEAVSGYHIAGKYYLDGTKGAFEFETLTLDTYE